MWALAGIIAVPLRTRCTAMSKETLVGVSVRDVIFPTTTASQLVVT